MADNATDDAMTDNDMTDNAEQARYRQYAGQVAFPRSPADLTSTTQCPACFAPLDGTLCGNCGLDLGNPAAGRLAETSNRAAELLDHRLDLIGRIRFDSAQAAATQSAAQVAAAAVAQAPAVAAPAVAAPAVAAPAVAEAAPVAPTAAPGASAAPRRSSVQVVLLIVGISLLSVAAIFFLVYAFITFGLIARSLIIGGITVAAFVVASLLRRRGLSATAEGIAAFTVVLVYLDAFAVRANDLFGLERVDGVAYWGWTLVISAVGFVLWSRLSGLRLPSIAGFTAVVPGVALVAGWLARDADELEPLFWAFAAGAAAALLQRLAVRANGKATTERVIVLSFGLLSILLAGGFAFGVGPHTDGLGALALLGVAAIAALHVLALDLAVPASSLNRSFGSIFAVIAGATASLAALSVALRVEQVAVTALVPLLAATVLALLFELLARRVSGTLSLHAAVAAWTSGALAALAVLISAAFLLVAALDSIVSGLGSAWDLDLDARLSPFSDGRLLGTLGLVLALTLVALAWAGNGTLRKRSPIIIWAASLLLVLAVPLLQFVWAIVAGWLAIAVAAVVALIALRRSTNIGHRAPLVTLTVLGGVSGWLAGWASTSTWLPASLIVIALLVLLRSTIASDRGRAALLAAATVVLFIGAGAGARLLALPLDPEPDADLLNALRAVGIVAVLLAGLAAVVRGGAVSTVDRRTMFWVSVPVVAVTAVVSKFALAQLTANGADGLLLPEYGTSVAVATVLLAGLVAWNAVPGIRMLRPERIVASLGIGPAVYWMTDSFARLIGFTEYVVSLAPIAAALLASVGALTVSLLRPASTSRWAREAGVALVAVPAVATALALRTDAAWLVLLLAAVTALVLAISSDGLFGSASGRKHVGWVALALGVAALWYRLAENEVLDLEPYVLPLAGALLAVALLIALSARRRGLDSRAAPALALAGALVAILPLAITGSSGPILRPLVVGGVSALLLLVGSLVIGTTRVRPYLDAASLTGALGVLIVSTGRAISITDEAGEADLRLDAWLFGAVLVLAVAAFGHARTRTDESAGLRRIASQVLAVLALVALLAFELPSFGAGDLAGLRAMAVLLLLCAVHVIAFVVRRAPLGRVISWVAIGLAAVTAIAGVATGALEWVEYATVPVAFALMANGAIHLASTPPARSWAWLRRGLRSCSSPR